MSVLIKTSTSDVGTGETLPHIHSEAAFLHFPMCVRSQTQTCYNIAPKRWGSTRPAPHCLAVQSWAERNPFVGILGRKIAK